MCMIVRTYIAHSRGHPYISILVVIYLNHEKDSLLVIEIPSIHPVLVISLCAGNVVPAYPNNKGDVQVLQSYRVPVGWGDHQNNVNVFSQYCEVYIILPPLECTCKTYIYYYVHIIWILRRTCE